ncbi:hypothetical protein MP638_003324 [Amoeboaphelidium occidentale]|nr:hypothetical protein MP638_003324 [Amoeboaphelidium occidentale]
MSSKFTLLSKLAAAGLIFLVFIPGVVIPQKHHLDIDQTTDTVKEKYVNYLLDIDNFHLYAAIRTYAFGIYVLWWYYFSPFSSYFNSGLYHKGTKVVREWRFIEVFGFVLSLVGYRLRLWAFDTLGKYFTYVVAIKGGHKLITDGPYEYLVHPSYTGAFACFLGALIFTRFNERNTVAKLITLIGSVVAFYFLYLRVLNEEQALFEEFGDDFIQYRATRARLIPFIF